MNDFDDRIREGLAADDGAPPTPPFADVERRARHLTRRRRAVTGGVLLGTVAIVAGIVAAQRPDDEDGHTVVVTQPETSTTASTEPAPETTTSTEPPPEVTTTTTPEAPARPSQAVVATTDGRILVLDVASGEVVSDLGRVESGPDAPLVHEVSVSADGSSVLASICCDVIGGQLLVIPTDGSGLEADGHDVVTNAYNVAIGPSTRPWTALQRDSGIAVTSGPVAAFADSATDIVDPSGGPTRGLAWSPDGRLLAWQSPTTLTVAEVIGEDDIRVVAEHAAPPGTYWSEPFFTYDGYIHALSGLIGGQEGSPLENLVRIDPASGEVLNSLELGTSARSLRCDPTGNWLMFVTTDDQLMLFEEDGSHRTIATGVEAADWMRD
jgi:hypothetical protein